MLSLLDNLKIAAVAVVTILGTIGINQLLS